MRARAGAVVAAGLVVGGALALPADAQVPRTTVIVTTAPGSPAAQLVERLDGHVRQSWTHALHGFSVNLPVPALGALSALPGVEAVQPDEVVRVAATQPRPPSWGLDRVDQRSLPLSNSYSYGSTGLGVTAYVIDTGLNYGHAEFRGRARAGHDAVTRGGGAVDCHGHGSHVAGTLGGTSYGVAKGVVLVGVRVLGCGGSGTTEQLVSGIDWTIAQHQAGAPAVANISIEGGPNNAVDRAVSNLVADGVTVVVAAANGGNLVSDMLGWSDACSYSPARTPAAITVAATDSADRRASYSNRGTCVDLFAPGSSIVSAWKGGSSAKQVSSGTSMASPHVAGVAALYLSRFRAASPSQVTDAIVGATTTGRVTGAGRAPNRLLFNAW